MSRHQFLVRILAPRPAAATAFRSDLAGRLTRFARCERAQVSTRQMEGDESDLSIAVSVDASCRQEFVSLAVRAAAAAAGVEVVTVDFERPRPGWGRISGERPALV